MSRRNFLHATPERFIAGTVGVPGERAFFIQVKSQHLLTSVAVEKTQVETLATRIQEIIKEIRKSGVASHDELNLSLPRDSGPLEFPLDEEFRVGIIALLWSPEEQRLILEFQAIADTEIEDMLTDDEAALIEDAPDLLAVHLRMAQARNFAERALALVSAGRQPCIFCGLPIDPDGHLCPRANGYRR